MKFFLTSKPKTCKIFKDSLKNRTLIKKNSRDTQPASKISQMSQKYLRAKNQKNEDKHQ